MRSYSLPWVLPSHYDDNFLLDVVDIVAFDFHKRDWSAHAAVPYSLYCDFWIRLYLFEQQPQTINVIRDGVGELNGIILNCKVILKSKGFVVFPWVIFIGKVIMFVKDIKSFSSPSCLIIFITLGWAYTRLHAFVIKRIGFVLHRWSHTKFTMLNLAMKLCFLFRTLKLYHWVNPPVLTSFCSRRS